MEKRSESRREFAVDAHRVSGMNAPDVIPIKPTDDRPRRGRRGRKRSEILLCPLACGIIAARKRRGSWPHARADDLAADLLTTYRTLARKRSRALVRDLARALVPSRPAIRAVDI